MVERGFILLALVFLAAAAQLFLHPRERRTLPPRPQVGLAAAPASRPRHG